MSDLRPLRIVGTAPVYIHPEWRGSGVARTATDLFRVLAQRGHFVTVVSPLIDGPEQFSSPTQTTYFDGHLKLVYVPEARGSRFGLGTQSRGLESRLAPVLANGDILHIHSFMSPWTDTAARLARRAGIPYVVQDHGKLTPSILAHRAGLKRLYLAIRGQRILRAAALVIPSAPSVAQALSRWDPRIHCATCTNGLDPAEFEGPPPASPLEQPYVLFMGWLDPRKNLDLLIRSFARVASQIPDWRLALVGPDHYAHASILWRCAKEVGVENRIVMPGMVQGKEKLAWFKHARMFALPSAGEGLSLAMLEAMACGIPLLLSPGCNYPEIEAAGGGRVLDLREEVWSDAILAWAVQPDQRRAAGAAARHLFEQQHTLDVVGAHLEGLLRLAVMKPGVSHR